MLNSTGTTTSVTVEGFSYGGGGINIYAGNNNPSTPDEQLNAGGLYVNPGFTVDGLTSGSTYNVYVYTFPDYSGITSGLTDGTNTYYGTSVEPDYGNPYVYSPVTSTLQASPTADGNYVKFVETVGVPGSFTIRTAYQNGGNAAIDGFQIVLAPELPTYALLGVGLGALILYARVHRSMG